MSFIMKQIVFLFVLGMVSSVLSQAPNAISFSPLPPSPGPCPTVPIVKNFNLHAYLGRWFEIERFFAPFQLGDCVTADYELFPNGSVSVINSQVENGQLDIISGFADLVSSNSEARLSVQFPTSRFNFSPPGVPNYNVVATDYKNFAVVYSCSSFGGNKIELSWILARHPIVPPTFLAALKDWLNKVNINAARYMPTRQDDSCQRRPLQTGGNMDYIV